MKHKLALALGGLFAFAALAAAAGNEEEVQKQIKNLKSKEASARKDAAEAIGKIGQIKASVAKPALQPLLDALQDADAKVRAASASALSKLDEPTQVVPALIRVVKEDKETPVKMAATMGLGLIGEPAKEAIPALRALQKDAQSDEQKRLARAANEAIRQINGTPRKKN
jgi:HEAT repeat protein